MRYIGYSTFFTKEKRIEFSKDELLAFIKNTKLNPIPIGINFSEDKFLKDILSTVPLFIKDGLYYKWAHKSLQEYFAAEHIYHDLKKDQLKVLEKIYISNKFSFYINLIDLYYNIDYTGFRYSIEKLFLEDFKKYLIKSTPKLYTISQDLINERLSLLFKRNVVMFFDSYSAFDKFKETQIAEIDIKYSSSGYVFSSFGELSNVISYITYVDTRLYLLNIFATKCHYVKTIKPMNFSPIKTIKGIQIDKLYDVNLKQSNPINSIANFEEINNILKSIYCSTLFNNYIDYNAALKELNKINQEIKLQKSNNFLTENI